MIYKLHNPNLVAYIEILFSNTLAFSDLSLQIPFSDKAEVRTDTSLPKTAINTQLRSICKSSSPVYQG